MAGIELLALRMARRIREHNEEVDRINQSMSTQTTPAPTEPKREVSRYALWAFNLIFAAFGALVASFILLYLGVVPVATLSTMGFLLLTSISLAVLSLRERN